MTTESRRATPLEFFDALREAGALRGDTWGAWRSFIAALFGLPMSEAEAEIFRTCTQRSTLPTAPFSEAWLVCGRRAGKSFLLALVATYLALFRDYSRCLGPGERATLMVIACDRKQARTVNRFVRGLMSAPTFKRMVSRETAEGLELRSGAVIEIHTASFRRTRGYALAAVLADELSFWPSEGSSSPDYEVLDALRPAMATIPNSLLLCASSPYRRRGALWDAHQRYFGRDDADVLVWKAPTRIMNSVVPQAAIDRAMERDAAVASAEYMCQFRSDVEGFVSIEVVQQCTEPGCFERPPSAKHTYFGFCDPSGGSSDSMTLAIAHSEGDVVVIDALREVVPPFSPDTVVQEFAGLLRNYGITTIQSDRYGGQWVVERFATAGIRCEPAELAKSALYTELLPRLNAGTIRLLDHAKLAAQLVGLERRHGTAKDMIDHPPNSHDDISNATAGAAHMARAGQFDATMAWAEHLDTLVGMMAGYGGSSTRRLPDGTLVASYNRPVGALFGGGWW